MPKVQSMPKVTVQVEQRSDGGLRVWSEELPNLVLSGEDREAVMHDLVPALELILSHKLQCKVEVSRLVRIDEYGAPALDAPPPTLSPEIIEFASRCS